MRKQIISLFLFVLLPLAAGAEEAKILSLSGNVEVRQGRDGQWASASENVQIPEGGALRTGAGGMAVLLMPNKTKVWLKENSNIEVEQRQTLVSRLALVFGKVKIRVPHLMRKEKFEVRTPAAVCAVRGTEFTMDTTEDGKMNIQVLFGEVKLKFTVPLEQGKEAMNILQGQTLTSDGKKAVQALSNKMTEWAALSNWNPGITKEESEKGLQQKEADRAEIKEFAKVTNGAEDTVKSFLNVVKESDLEAGRTLNDVHGNLVRVDQRMVRPAANEIQFFNLVKRANYGNFTANSKGFAYNGGAVTSRLDYMQMTMAFNKDLPQRIEEWPSFFSGNSVDPTWASFVLANRTDASEIFFIAENSINDTTRNNGDGGLVNNTLVVGIAAPENSATDRNVVITGVLKDEAGMTAVQGLDKISNLQVKDALAGTGTLKYTDENRNITATAVNGAASDVVWAIKTANANSYSEPDNSPENAPLVHYQADMYSIGNQGGTNANDYLWLANESYVINNSGQVRTASDFTNSSSDPFTLLKENAVETVMYVKKSISGDPASIKNTSLDPKINNASANAFADISGTDYFAYKHATNGTNIDVVFIPDLLVAAVQRMLPAITNMGDSNNNN